jgi:hypothetical protein
LEVEFETTKEESMNLQEKISLAISQIVKDGDTVLNAGGNEMIVKKVNKKTLITVSSLNGKDISWKWSEIHLPKSRNPEILAAIKAMRSKDIQNTVTLEDV